MRFFKNYFYCLFFLLANIAVDASEFPIVTSREKATILYDGNGPALDSIAAHLLAADIERATGYLPHVSRDVSSVRGNVIVIGNIHSGLLQKLSGDYYSFFTQLHGRKEVYAYRVVDNPAAGISKAFVIGGTDARGTAYGVFSLSEKIGVSPWYWWADVPVARKKQLAVSQFPYISSEPSVAYRGIFINDEDWGLLPWASNTFEPGKKNIGPRTYEKVFELLLRLKANLLWPAMHPGTEPFFIDERNRAVARAYSIVVGTSHAEPMARNNVGEWDEKAMGKFNYVTNKERVINYWEDRVKQSRGNDVMFTVGMRGVHDSKMEGVKDTREAVALTETIINDQRELLRRHIADPVTVPQVFTAYKEVLEIYDAGLKIPDDITIVWPDDNYGYIQRLNNRQERNRKGGSGVYYHASYWGRPHDYLWLSTTHPSLIREEMTKAFETGARSVWVLNVGDIKPLEYNIQLFLDMAYDVKPFLESSYTKKHLLAWHQKIFGPNGSLVSDIIWKYYNLAFERRPEFMGWSQTEPTTKTNYTTYNHFNFGDEAQRRIDQYKILQAMVSRLRKAVQPMAADAFYQLVYYPVTGAALMNKKFIYRDKTYVYGKQNRISAYDYARASKDAYERIIRETRYYNDSVSNGKWKGLMSMKPRDLPVFHEPVLAPIDIQKGIGWSIAPEGVDTVERTNQRLPVFTDGLNQWYFVDIFLTDSNRMHWTAKASDSWITISKRSGTLLPGDSSEERIWISVNWRRAPKMGTLIGEIVFKANGKEIPVQVRAQQNGVANAFRIPIETNGYVSIFAQHYSKLVNTPDSEWRLVKDLGHTGSSLMSSLSTPTSLQKSDVSSIQRTAAYAQYDFYSFSSVTPTISIYTLPTHPLNDSAGMRYGLSVNDGAMRIVDFKTVGRSEEWKQNVLRNSAIRRVSLHGVRKGRNTIKIYAIDPAVVLDRMLITFGGVKTPYSVVPETRKK